MEAMAILFPEGLPYGLDRNRPIPNGGQKLSRGQRARLALLAMVSEPSGTWLLDEPLSALPADQRRSILTALLELRGQAIVILAEPVVPDGLSVRSTIWEPPQGLAGPTILLATPV
jgi:ABC-type bacteriocin/lantibiotic exporter with double-glycine peptidase domain